MLFNNNDIKNLKIVLTKEKNICIISHTNPDGDTIGSALGLYGVLQNSGYNNISLLVPNDFPDFLKWMKNSDKYIVEYKNKKKVN